MTKYLRIVHDIKYNGTIFMKEVHGKDGKTN